MQPDLATDIVACFALVDDILQHEHVSCAPVGKKRGRPSALSESELVTLVIYATLTFKVRHLKDVWQIMRKYHARDFPRLPSYQAFVAHLHRALPVFSYCLTQILNNSKLRFLDSTALPVCRLIRAKFHRVAREVARYGKNHQGWWYGFKLHAAVDSKGALCAVWFTPANVHDQNITPILTEGQTKLAVGDTGYLSSVMNRLLWEERGVMILTPPHHKQTRKLMTAWQFILLRARSKIEAVFDYLKEHLNLVTSFPRSTTGYLVHYIRVLLAYQFSLLRIS